MEKGRDVTKFGAKECRMPRPVDLDARGRRVSTARGWVKNFNMSAVEAMDLQRVPEDERTGFLYLMTAMETGIAEREKLQRGR